MKIHLTGTRWQGAITENMQRAFEAMGHEVLFFDKHLSKNYRVVRNLAMRFVRKPFELENYFFEISSRPWLESLRAFRPDLIIIEDAPNILASAIERAKAEFGRPIFYYETSPPHGSGARDVLLSFKYVDEVFCIDREWAKLIAHLFPKPIHHLPLAGNPDDFHPLAGTERIYDAVMVASAPEQTPDGVLRANFINEIPREFRVAAFGSGWGYWPRYFPNLEGRLPCKGAPGTAEVNKIYNQSKIVINFHSTGHTTSISSRTFEVALAGGFQVADYREDLDVLFPKGTFPLFSTTKELNGAIAHWSAPARDREREEKAKKIREHVLAHHTWRHRAEKIIEVFKRY